MDDFALYPFVVVLSLVGASDCRRAQWPLIGVLGRETTFRGYVGQALPKERTVLLGMAPSGNQAEKVGDASFGAVG